MGAIEHNIRHWDHKISPAATRIGIDPATLHAFAGIEVGAIDAKDDGWPVMRFEVHRYLGKVGGISPYVQLRSNAPDGSPLPNAWHRLAHWYKSDPASDWEIVHTGSQGDEYGAMAVAQLQDGRQAMRCASYGVGQIMGWHSTLLGYRNVRRMVGAAVAGGVLKQIDQWVRYIERDREGALLAALQGEPDWATAVEYYNGPGQVEAYSRRLVQLRDDAARLLVDGVPEDHDLSTWKARQQGLAALGYLPASDVDGDFGPDTRAALVEFQRASGLNPDGWWGPKTEHAMLTQLELTRLEALPPPR